MFALHQSLRASETKAENSRGSAEFRSRIRANSRFGRIRESSGEFRVTFRYVTYKHQTCVVATHARTAPWKENATRGFKRLLCVSACHLPTRLENAGLVLRAEGCMRRPAAPTTAAPIPCGGTDDVGAPGPAVAGERCASERNTEKGYSFCNPVTHSAACTSNRAKQ